MKILIAVASKHGSTYEIGRAIKDTLQEAGFSAVLKPIKQSPIVENYDAAIIGSAVYMGRWMSEAKAFLEDNQDELHKKPVWLFSSGPTGEDATAIEGEPFNLDQLMATVRAVGHQVFVGKLDKQELGLREKLVISMVKAPTGDFRDWQAVSNWANEIAKDLSPEPIPA